MGLQRVIPRWTRNLGYMLAETLQPDPDKPAAEIFVGCSKCQVRERLTAPRLAELILAKGPLYSLWNRHPRCARCGGRRYYSGSSGGPGAPVFPLSTDPDNVTVVSLHQRWKAEQKAERVKG